MRIFVSGGAGFIGSHVARAYAADGHEVLIGDIREPQIADSAVSSVVLDLRCAEEVERVVQEFRPQVISHHAAQIDVRKSVDDPASDAETNIVSGLNLLKAGARVSARRFIFASSGGAVYGEPSSIPVVEETDCHPLSPYGLAKQTFEKYLALITTEKPLIPVVLRYSNVFGPGQSYDGEAGVISIFIGKILRGEQCQIYGSGASARDYVFVDDVVRANQLALTLGDGGSFNIATGCLTTVIEVFRAIRDAVFQDDLSASILEPVFLPPRRGEVERIALANDRARRELHWLPATSFRDGVEQTVRWQTERLERTDLALH